MRLSLVLLVLTCSVCVAPWARASDAARPVLEATRVSTPPVIDGVLDDAAWSAAPLATPADEWKSYNPLHGTTIPQQTRVWIAYDTRFIYVAFDCQDPEPERIKTSVTRRDDIFSDDWVGLSLDALGTGQTSYHMMVNPSGVQLDMLNSVSGEEDLAPDWVWDSAGHRTATGYSVEIRLPLQSIRFAGGERVKMGVLFWRRVSRLGVSVAWPALEPGKWVFEKHASLTFRDLDAIRTRELVPAATWTGSQSRETTPGWTGFSGRGDLGVSGRMGITSTVTLDATVNPDFSQVESDAFQVEVNQRFPIFFSEKRPFFMEGADIFKLAGLGNGDASMLAAVHTRRIIDPIAGAKITGTLGRVAFGSLSAADESAGRGVEAGERGHDRSRIFNVGRVQYSLGAGSNVGAIVTDTRFAGDDNQVVGADLAWRVHGTQRVTLMALQSWSRVPSATSGANKTSGAAVMAGYGASSKRAQFQTQFEHYDRDFRMDTAFYNRTGFTAGWVYGDLSFYPPKAKTPWLLRISPFTFQQGGTDRMARGDERMNATGIRVSFTRQGFLRVDQLTGVEPWQGREYGIHRTRAMGQVQPYRWLNLSGRVTGGDAIFYDKDNPYAGRSRDVNVDVTFQPTGRFTESLGYTHVGFDRASTGARVYTIDVLNSRATYQFTRELAVRGTVRYDGSERRILTDLLAAWELRPGTLVYVGYGALSEQRRFVNGEWLTHEGDYLGIRRGLFLKTSYLHRF